ncbi:zinc finger protein 541 [Pyxicephalus adspersus]|uniref:zinc finger protein 541 n=1 Tax=Pyxicephalus adspersus TaxID=30357 RepID=UPI003B5C2445
MSLYTWSVDHLLQPDDPIVNLRQHVLQFSPDPIQPNHPGQNLKLTSRTQEEFPNCDTFPAMKNTVETDLGLLHPERNRCPYSKKPQLECRVCGKMFRSTSSLTKHVASHSQERKHVCDICKKAFKRQDHLNGHMLTHQNSKPYVCTELGCNKSYCDSRSLKRHLIVNHGQVTGKNISALNSTCNESLKKEQPMPFLLLPLGTKVQKVPLQASLSIMDLIRYQINSQEKMVSNEVIQDSSRSPRVEAEHTHLDSIPSNTYTLVNDTSEVSEGPRILLYPDQDP